MTSSASTARPLSGAAGRSLVAGLACVVGFSIALAACGGGRDDGSLVVAAASDLALAMPELAASFEAATGVPVRATLGSSGVLAQQILHGAGVDVLLSADGTAVQRLAGAGRTVPGSEGVYAFGRLVLVAATGRAAPTSL
jgi:molybdate transport system substrate-binding protein